MRRRDVFHLIAALPVAVCIQSAEEISSGDFDTVVVKVKGEFSQHAWERMKEQLLRVWPDKRVCVMPEYMDFEYH
ncbi:MAG: hypothetical protein ACYSW3_29560 [Planctomycetota bacterium]|jgi:hypothetical protein